MPRARTKQIYRQTAAIPHEPGSGCLSGYILPPLAVIFISALLASVAWKQNIHADLPYTPSKISPIFTPEIQYWGESISQWAARFELDPNLVATIMQIESCGDPRAKSSAGALGLFQVMPFHFYAADNPYAPDTNAERGIAYLKRSLEAANGDARLALAGYNGGIGVITRAEWAWSAQTKRYVQYGAPIYSDARSGSPSSAALLDWYKNYGVNLCKQANQRLGLN